MRDLFYLFLFAAGSIGLFFLLRIFIRLQRGANALGNAFPGSAVSKAGKRVINLEDLDPYYVPGKHKPGLELNLVEQPVGQDMEPAAETGKTPVRAVADEAVGVHQDSLESIKRDELCPAVGLPLETDSLPEHPSIHGEDESTDGSIFKHEEIQGFYADCIKKELPEPYLDIAVQIMQLFDDDFGMSSVAKLEQYKEPDNEFNESEFNALAKIPLWRHAFNTVEEYIQANRNAASSAGVGSSHPLTILACLGHDIGKLTVFRSKYYVHGEHAATGADVLEKLTQKRLKAIQQITLASAVRSHHYKISKGLDNIAIKLMEADRRARKRELLGQDLFKVEKVMAHTVEESEDEKYDTSEILVPWFNANEYLEELKPFINNPKLCRISYYGVSMKDGNVYFYGKVMYEAFVSVAKRRGAPEADIYKEKDDQRRLMIYLVKELKKIGVVADELIQDGFFCAPFIAKMQNMEKGKSVLLTPIRAQAFNLDIGKEEISKSGFFADFISITPNYGKVTSQK